MDDWLRAEREVLWCPPAELIEDETQFRLQLAVPGIEPGSRVWLSYWTLTSSYSNSLP
jgi:hypothetical protein